MENKMTQHGECVNVQMGVVLINVCMLTILMSHGWKDDMMLMKTLFSGAVIVQARYHHQIQILTVEAHMVDMMKDSFYIACHDNNTSSVRTFFEIIDVHRHDIGYHAPPRDRIMFMTSHHMNSIPTQHAHTVRVMKGPHNTNTSLQQHIINDDIHQKHRCS